MAHREQKEFFNKVKDLYPTFFDYKKVLDCGSLNVNGSLRELFTNCEYLGVDIVEGRDVDLVCPIHKLDLDKFDVVVSAEMLEHDEYWKESLRKMYDLSNGLIAISCAGKDRPEHGTTRTGSNWGTSSDYYRNIEPNDIKEIYKEDMFKEWYFEENTNSHDTYFYGIIK